MSKIWFIMVVGSICALVFINPSAVLPTMIEQATSSLQLAFELCAVYAVWLGILQLVEDSGLGEKLARLLRPLIRRLFNINDGETEKYIALNISANMLGLGNAATPMGLEAVKRLDDKSGIATHAVITLIVLNSTSIQLLPSTIIGLRTSAGSASPADIIIPTILATICTASLGIILVKLIGKLRKRKVKV